MSYDVGFSRSLEKRIGDDGGYYSLFVDVAELNEGDAVDLLYDILRDIREYVRDGDSVLLFNNADRDVPEFEFPLQVSDKYLGDFEFKGHSLKGTKVDDGDDLPYVRITDADSGREICLLRWFTVGNGAEAYIECGLRRAAEKAAA